jgi:hypothetical protein
MVINNYVLENIVKFYEYLCFLVVIDVWLLFLLNAACLAEKQQIPILLSLVLPDRGSNPRCTAPEASTLTITRPMRLKSKIFTYVHINI